MNSNFLSLFINNLNNDGIIMSSEIKSATETSLKVLKNEMNFCELFYWGRISTMSQPYYVVQGIENPNRAMDRRTLCSQDCINWVLLNPPNEKLRYDVRKIKGMLTGLLSDMGENEEAIGKMMLRATTFI